MSIEPLPTGQQLLLQRLMATNVLADDDSKELFDTMEETMTQPTESSQSQDPLMGHGITTLEEAFASINASLKPAFGLEIVTMIDTTEQAEESVRYHAVVNSHNVTDDSDDVVSKEAFGKAYNPHERAFVRKLLEAMVHDEDYSLKRKDCVNLRNDLEGGFKLDLNQAERVVQVLLDEQWLRISARQDDEDDNNSDDDEPKKKKRRMTIFVVTYHMPQN